MRQQVKENAIAGHDFAVWKNLEVRCKPLPKEAQTPIYDFFKRIFDIVLASCALVLLSWLIGLAAIMIKIEDNGPAIYTQTRVGKNGKFFKMYKLRSMYIDADERKKELLDKNEMDGPVFKMKNDPRITKVGAIFRKFSIDELPQLWNVINGTMSIVGPRPPMGYEVMQYDEYAMRRLSIKPGLTCYWQCSGRNNIDFDNWMKLDNKYIDERSFWRDIAIIFKTIPIVLNGDGAR